MHQREGGRRIKLGFSYHSENWGFLSQILWSSSLLRWSDVAEEYEAEEGVPLPQELGRQGARVLREEEKDPRSPRRFGPYSLSINVIFLILFSSL